MPGQTISIPATDGSGTFDIYLTGPSDGKAPAIVLLHEIYGVRPICSGGWNRISRPITGIQRHATRGSAIAG
jgi:dienelactone hydrolase